MFDDVADDVPEWASVRQAVEASRARDPAAWAAFAPCLAIEVYTDGSAPLQNPGGAAGFAAVVVGFQEAIDFAAAARPPVAARLDLGGYIPARATPPATSNNRAEIAGVLAGLHALQHLGWGASHTAPPHIWSDSTYVVECAAGRWQRKKNTDLWPLYDAAEQALTTFWPAGAALAWVKGHADNPFNAAADELATRAAFNFAEAGYTHYRAAQAATGREMPGAALAAPALPVPPAAAPAPTDWLQGADYTLVLFTRLDGGGQPNVGRGPCRSRYQLWTRNGRGRQGAVAHAGERFADEAEYLTLIAALTDLAGRITAAGRDPAAFTVTIYSHHELMVKQLAGTYRVKAAALQAPFAAAGALLGRFARVDLIWRPAHMIRPLFPSTGGE
ncbi:MAG TPA: RNase H family protein [Chloroflexia bacterium]|nr:RNase H family protein [Chloroflexia bacterium]